MSGSPVLIAGSGHLADRLEGLLRPTRAVARVDAVRPGPLAPFEEALERANIRAAVALYVVDDGDAANVQFALAALKVRPELPMTMALSNERLVPHLQELHPNLSVVNPWEIVTPDIVQALKAPASTAATSAAALPPSRIHRPLLKRGSVVLMALAAAFATLLAAATVFFHYSERLDWISAVYFVVTMLRAENYPVLVIEKNADNQFLATIREKRIPVMIADATVANTLVDAAVDRASAVASLVNDDLVSLEVGLNARAIHPRIRVILRIFDGDTANELRQRLNIHYTISTSTIAARAILEREAPTTGL